MINMMKADLYRILKGKAIYIVILIIILLSTVSIIGLSAGHIGLGISSSNMMEDTEMAKELMEAKSLKDVRRVMKNQGSFPLDKEEIGQNVNLYYLFIVIVVMILCTDFSNKTVKNTLSSAISRKKYYLSKLILIFGISTILILFHNYGFYIANYLINGKEFSSSLTDVTKITIIQLPLIYGIISLLVCFAFLFKKTSTFNTISIPFIMAIQLIVIGITSLFKWKADWFYNYELQFALANLANNPTGSYLIKCIGLGIIYIIIFNLIGYYAFIKSEIK